MATQPETSEQQQQQQPVLEDPLAKDLWAFASKKMTQINQPTKTLIFVGEKQCGKSSLINKFLDQGQVKEEMQETTALEFKSGLKLHGDKRVKTDIYELGGGRNFANLLEAALAGSNLANTTICIVVDLTKPGNSIESVLFWLKAVSEHTQAALAALDPEQQAQVQQATREKWGGHEDRERLNLPVVPISIIGAKFDAYANQNDTSVKKQLCMALRYLAHNNGSDLVFASVREKLPSQLYRSLLMAHLFEMPAQVNIEVNPANAIHARAGQDSLSRIDEPEGAGQRQASMDHLWQEMIERIFPRIEEKSLQAAQKMHQSLSRYPEEKVDQMRRQKDEELEQYIKQTQRAKRFEAKANQVIGDQQQPSAASAAQQQQDRRQRQFNQMPASKQQEMMHGSGPKRRARPTQ